MATNTERLDELEKRVTSTEHPKWTHWIPIGAPVIGLVAVIVTLGLYLDSKIGVLQKDAGADRLAINTRIDKMDAAIKALTSQQSDQTQKLIQSLLAAAKTSAQTGFATRATQAAATLTTTLKQGKRPAIPDFFQIATKDIRELSQRREPDVKTAAFAAQEQLAEYRSALVPLPQDFGVWTFKPMPHAVKVFPNSQVVGGFLDVSAVSGDAFVVGAATRRYPLPFVQDSIVKGGIQTLDGFEWKHVTFIGTHIRYKGGEVKLENAVFINCTFDLPRNLEGTRVAEYATLLLPSLTVERKHS